MALCESQLDCVLPQQLKREQSPGDERGKQRADDKQSQLHHNGDIYALNQVPGGLPLSVDYRSPVSHFVPPAVELYAARQKQEQSSAAESSQPVTPVKRKRGRPRIDKTSPEYLASLAARKQAREMAHSSVSSDRVRVSHQATPGKRNRGRPRIDKTDPEYLANLAARKQARDIAAMMNNSRTPESGEKRKRGRPRVDKTSPEYLARKRARELEALERKAKREYKRRATGGLRSTDSAASSSAGESTPRTKRKYTKRTPNTKKDATGSTERIKGKRGRPRKVDQITANKQLQQPKIRVRNNLMPVNTEPISLDSDDEPDLGSPSQASDSLSLDENLRAIRHIHEKYANIDKDDRYEAHLLAANFKKPTLEPQRRDDEDVLSVRSSEGCGSVKDAETKIEKLEDSSNSDSDSSSSGSGSSSSGSSTSSSSDSSSSDSSDSESDSEVDKPKTELPPQAHADNTTADDDRSFGAWSYSGAASGSDSEPDPEREAGAAGPPPPGSHDEISESENESADKSFQCHICSKWYSTRVTLKIHRRVHLNRGGGARRSRARSGDRYECDCCSMTFNRREKLWEHRAEVHRGAMTVRCDVCKKCFEDDAELAAHAGGHTDDERAGRCSWCGASFPRWEQLRRHRAVAHGAGGAGAAGAGAGGGGAGAGGGGAPHACAVCGKRFGHAHSLTRHMHNHAKQLYRCVVCKASFDRADQLANHLNSHLANYKRLKP